MDPNTFALGFIVGIVCTLVLIAMASRLDRRYRQR